VAVTVLVALSSRVVMGLALAASGIGSVVMLSVVSGYVGYRYAALSASLIAAALIVAVGGREASRRLRIVALGALCAPWLLSLPVSTFRGDVPSWDVTVSRARVKCAEGSTNFAHLAVGPYLGGRPWGTVDLACDKLD
jgi:hypothetical protein